MVYLIKETVNLTKTNILQHYILHLHKGKPKLWLTSSLFLSKLIFVLAFVHGALLNDTNVISLFNISFWTFVKFICQK